MKEIRDYFVKNFDQIYCINLDKRKDRWYLMEIFFQELGIFDLVLRYSAVEYAPGNIGCALSHAAVLKDAKMKGYNKIFVFEDDVETKDMSLFLRTILAYPASINRKLLLFGYSFLYINGYDEVATVNNYRKIGCGLSGAMAIGYDNCVFDDIIAFVGNELEGLKEKMSLWTGFDRWLAIVLQRKYLTLISSNNLLYEGATLSNIKNGMVDIYPRMQIKRRVYGFIFANSITRFLYKNYFLSALKVYWKARGRIA